MAHFRNSRNMELGKSRFHINRILLTLVQIKSFYRAIGNFEATTYSIFALRLQQAKVQPSKALYRYHTKYFNVKALEIIGME